MISSTTTFLAGLMVAASMCFVLTLLIRRYALDKGVLDEPGPRSSHQRTTPRGGGMAIAVVVVADSLLLGWLDQSASRLVIPIAIGVAAIAALGWWDDHRSLSARFRFGLQLAICVCAMLWLGGLGMQAFGGATSVPSAGWNVIALIGMIWVTNLFNFMDGSDGLAGVEAIFSLGFFAVVFLLEQALIPAVVASVALAATTGFLPWNLPTAKIFMGDSGSSALGFLLAALCIVGSHHNIPVQMSFIALSVFVVDATATLLLRIARGERWYNPHRQHAYQRLLRGGWSHGQVLLLLMSVNAVLIAPALYVSRRWPAWQWPVLMLVTILLLAGWLTIQRRYSDNAVGDSEQSEVNRET